MSVKYKFRDQERLYFVSSLGGGLAEANSIVTGDKAITFNGAGLSLYTSFGRKANTEAFVMVTDPLNFVQSITPGLSTAGGKKHFLQPRSTSGIYNGHSINAVIDH